MNAIKKVTLYIVVGCDKNPVFTTVLIFLFMIFFNILEATVETLIFGSRFEHWLDVIFIGAFMAWAAYAVLLCALLKCAREVD